MIDKDQLIKISFEELVKLNNKICFYVYYINTDMFDTESFHLLSFKKTPDNFITADYEYLVGIIAYTNSIALFLPSVDLFVNEKEYLKLKQNIEEFDYSIYL